MMIIHSTILIIFLSFITYIHCLYDDNFDQETTLPPTESYSEVIKNAHDLASQIQSLQNDITSYLSKLNNNSEVCTKELLKNVELLSNNVTNDFNNFVLQQQNIVNISNQVSKISEAVVCMKNSNCVPSPTTTNPTTLATLKPITNNDCVALNSNGVISNGKENDEINCIWNLNVPESKYLILTINYLFIQGGAFLTIVDKNNQNETTYNSTILDKISISSYSNNYDVSINSTNPYSGASFSVSYISVDVCGSNYCQNGGQCSVKPDNTPSCTCINCFGGDNCGEKLDMCANNKKCKTDNSNNKCVTEDNGTSCIAKCYCNGSTVGTSFCST
uniref:EGF-like domain-containing protein n=1 Tax=Parastrongyloides trichosuri TaxID=131310 RepID=A0A0N4Z0G8_PARTI